MIHVGAIKKVFKGTKLLICAWVSDNSPLKSQYFCKMWDKNNIPHIKIGKGYIGENGDCYILGVSTKSILSYIRIKHPNYMQTISFVLFGVGKFRPLDIDSFYVEQKNKEYEKQKG
jgi:hypothetical protein